MPDGGEARKKPNPYVDCLVQYVWRPLLVVIKILCFLLAGLLLMCLFTPGLLILLILGPICLFGLKDRTVPDSCHAPLIRYATQGVTLPGRVVEKHEHCHTDEGITSYTGNIKSMVAIIHGNLTCLKRCGDELGKVPIWT
jgi:hypothetical protein